MSLENSLEHKVCADEAAVTLYIVQCDVLHHSSFSAAHLENTVQDNRDFNPVPVYGLSRSLSRSMR